MMRSALMVLMLLAGSAFASESSRIPLNSATAQQLASLEGINAGLAEQIVALRDKRGSLSSVESLRILPDITDASLDSLRAGTSIELAIPEMQAKTYDTPEQVLAEFANEPSIQQVQAWASDYAKTNPTMVQRWLRASSSFAALPEVQLEYELKNDWDQDFLYRAADGTELVVADQEPVAILQDADVGQDQKYKVRLKWELDKLVMSSERIRVLQEAQDIAKLRDNVLNDVTELYFERRRLQVEMLLNPSSDLKKQVRDTLQLQELTASVDALTGGAFSGALSR